MMILFVLAFFVASVASQECGRPVITPNQMETFIVGGRDAKAGSWPWQANLRSSGSGGYQFCGGSLINDQFILTAAHCYFRDQPAGNEVGLGYHHVDANGDSGTQTIAVKTIIMHEDYNNRNLANDICLLQLANPVKFTDTISPVCLPKEAIADGEETRITGWGDAEKFFNPTNLQEATVPIIPRATCNRADWYDGEILDGMMCAGFEQGGIDTCQGDSGGPLVYLDGHGHYSQHGVTSWGYGCADAKQPGVYTDVFYYLDWINEKIAQYGG